MNKIKFKVIKDHPTIQGMLYKDQIVTVDAQYKSFVNEAKIQVKDLTGKIWFVETKYLKKIGD
tara:strand:+ start:107 stop:295 length:189 start_codon:yes stop_codon:yes gene_type:complete